MKKIFYLLIAFCGVVMTTYAQMRKPVFRPDWVFEAPRPSNGTYLYVVEHGEGNTKREALNQALGRVFQSTANRIGQAISTDEINKAVSAGTDYEVIARNMKVPINKVCEFPVQDTITNSWTMYVLCQVARTGNITPEFEATDECTKHIRFSEAMKRWKAEQEAIEEAKKQKEEEAKKALKREQSKSNARALVGSTFIPGLGQMLKGHGGKGTAFLLSEVVLFGGGTVCYFLGQNQAKIMKATGTTYEQYTNAKNMKNTLDIAMYAAFGAGAAVHIGNMVHAWVVQDKRLAQNLTFAPAIIPLNEYSQPSYAYGAGVQIKF